MPVSVSRIPSAGELATRIGWMTGLPSGLHSFDPATVAMPCNAGNCAGRNDVRRFSVGTVSAALTARAPLAGYVAMARGHHADGVDVHAAGNDQVVAPNAPHLRPGAVEAAVPWQPMDALELVFAKIKRSDVSAAPFPLIEGDLLQLQLQLQINDRVLQPDERHRARVCGGAMLLRRRHRSPAAGWSAPRPTASAADPRKHQRATALPVLHE